MPNFAKRNALRPTVDHLEPLVLLSGTVNGVTDLKGTSIAADVNRTILDSTASFRRDNVYLHSLTADHKTGMIRGGAIVTYKVPIVGSVTSTILFKTSIDKPRPRDVFVKVSKFGNFVSNKDRQKVSIAIAKLIQKDHDAIVAAMDA